MTRSTTPQGLTLAVYPTGRGFGWVAMLGPLAPHHGEAVDAAKDINRVCLRKIEILIDDLQPEAVVLEAFERRNSARTDRIAALCRAVVALCASRGIEVAIYTHAQVEECFAAVGARSRQEIAEAVARHLPALQLRLPTKRKPWKQEDRRMALFASAALVLTHFRHEALWFLDQQRGNA